MKSKITVMAKKRPHFNWERSNKGRSARKGSKIIRDLRAKLSRNY